MHEPKPEILYDVHHTNRRYMSSADMKIEKLLLGLPADCTIKRLSDEIHRRGLDDFSLGRAVKGANA
jgi:hypothetical protein